MALKIPGSSNNQDKKPALSRDQGNQKSNGPIFRQIAL